MTEKNQSLPADSLPEPEIEYDAEACFMDEGYIVKRKALKESLRRGRQATACAAVAIALAKS
jgi:hypothetical protein